MNADSMSAMTGMSKVRRGGGRHKAPTATKSTPAQHMENVTAAMAKGDHAGAKSHALCLAKALHASTKK